jgi:transposase-like protein
MAVARYRGENCHLIAMPNKRTQPRRYQENYKYAAADFMERSGQGVERSAAELGVDPDDLREWKKKLGVRAKRDKPLGGMARLRAENEALRNQVVQLQMQWDILKTTLGVLSTTVCSHEAS